MTTPSDKTDIISTVKEDILFDIFIYEKELQAPNLKREDIERIQEDIERAEELFKTIK